MRFSVLTIAASIGLAVVAWPRPAATQDGRDFVFTDPEGHLVLRFAGSEPGGLEPDQIDEIVNAEFSTMVHDRLRADIRFDTEPVDSEWAELMEPQIAMYLGETGPDFWSISPDITVRCRSASCRLLLEHTRRLQVSEHRLLMGRVQRALQAFMESNPASFEPVFLMAAYDQELEVPHIKAFLRRTPAQN
jgi:hypothetical protein